MRVVLDTNIIISGMLWGGIPRAVLTTAIEKQPLTITSEALVDELRDVLKRPKFQNFLIRINQTPDKLVEDYLRYTTVVEPTPLAIDTVRDVKDVKVLEAAVGGEATHIVSGDNDLLVLQSFGNIVVLDGAGFMRFIEQDNKSD